MVKGEIEYYIYIFFWTNGKYWTSTGLMPCQHLLRRLRVVSSRVLCASSKKQARKAAKKKCLAFNACVSRHPVVGENSVVMIYD